MRKLIWISAIIIIVAIIGVLLYTYVWKVKNPTIGGTSIGGWNSVPLLSRYSKQTDGGNFNATLIDLINS